MADAPYVYNDETRRSLIARHKAGLLVTLSHPSATEDIRALARKQIASLDAHKGDVFSAAKLVAANMREWEAMYDQEAR